MSAPVRTSQEGTFFITAVCAERRRIFQTDANAQLMFDVLQHYRSTYRLHAFVIMPEHIHLLLTPLVTLERSMQCIKGGFSKRYHDAGGATTLFGSVALPIIACGTGSISNIASSIWRAIPWRDILLRRPRTIDGRRRIETKLTSAAKAARQAGICGTAEAVPFRSMEIL